MGGHMNYDFELNDVLNIILKEENILRDSKSFLKALRACIRRKYPAAQLSTSFTAFEQNSKTDIDRRRNNLYVRYHGKIYPILLFWLMKGSYLLSDRTEVKKTKSLAVNIALIDIWKRLTDLELLSAETENYGYGSIIVLTNDMRIWKDYSATDNAIAAFSLHDMNTPESGTLVYRGKKPETVNYKHGPYHIEWKDSDGKKFRYLALRVVGEKRQAVKDLIIHDLQSAVKLFAGAEYGSVFYRGQAGFRYVPLPNALRHNDKIDYERKIFTEVITQHPDLYIGKDNLQKLSRMQHGGIPTRMMDVSLNPLTSLFFVVSGLHGDTEDDKRIKDEKSCWLFSFNDVDDEVRSFDSDTCRCLAALPYLPSEYQMKLRYEAVMEHFLQSYCRWIKACEDSCTLDTFHWNLDLANSEKPKGLFKLHGKEFRIEPVDKDKSGMMVIIPEEPDDSLIDYLYEDDFASMRINAGTGEYNSREMLVLDGKIASEAPAFRKCIHPLTLLNGVFVRPVSNSDRMIAQQGAFMLYGLSDFWNVPRMIEFLCRKGFPMKEILRILIINDRKPFEGKGTTEMLRDFASFVLAAEIYEVDFDKRERIKADLSSIGINKETMGRSEITTFHYFSE